MDFLFGGAPPKSDMPNHPNSNPTKEHVRAAREAAGLTQTAAARLIYSTMRAWQEWEAGNRRMHPGLWELFQIKTGEPSRNRTYNLRFWRPTLCLIELPERK